jgi:hypothetical protein
MAAGSYASGNEGVNGDGTSDSGRNHGKGSGPVSTGTLNLQAGPAGSGLPNDAERAAALRTM